MSRQSLNWVTAIACISIASLVVARASLVPPHGPMQFVRGFPGSDIGDPAGLTLFVQVARLVEDNYVHKLTAEKRRSYIEHAIQSGLQSLDEHSAYIPPEQFRRFAEIEQGHFGGVGIQVGLHPLTGELMVQTPIPNTPASQVGLRSGDIIVSVDDQQFADLDDAVRRIKGPPNTKVRLTVRPWGQSDTRVVELERGEIPIETVTGVERLENGQWSFWLDPAQGLAYVHLEAFNPGSAQELHQVLERLQQQKLRGFVLDLRGNPGGRLETAVEIAEMFLPYDSTVVTVRGWRRIEETYRVGLQRGSIWYKQGLKVPLFPDLPLVVLIDRHSASASEILASALQDNRRAPLVGNRTFGKASVQTIIPLSSGQHALKLTTAEYLRPSGLNIHRYPGAKENAPWGVSPDLLIPLTNEDQEQVLISRRLRGIMWQTDHRKELAIRFNSSTALLGSIAATIDPDNALYVRAYLLTSKKDKVLDSAQEMLLQLINQ